MPKNLKPLLPAPENQEAARHVPSEIQLPKKPRMIRIACETCRTRKMRCDGLRPECCRCLKSGLLCAYRTEHKHERDRKCAELVKKMMAADDKEALAIFQRLRTTQDPETVLSTLEGSMSKAIQPSALRTARAVSTPTFSDLEFELRVCHQSVFSALPVLDMSLLNMQNFMDGASTPASLYSSDMVENAARQLQSTDSLAIFQVTQEPPVIDSRFKNLDMAYWTWVPINNQAAANIISAYLRTSHLAFGLFDAETFVRDLVDRKLNYCSPFLVNAMMAYACLSYSSTDSNISSWSTPFIRSTEALWRAERSSDSTLNVAAMYIFSMACVCNDDDDKIPALEILNNGYQMAERLKLFGVEPNRQDVTAAPGNPTSEDQKADGQTAWGVYNLTTSLTFFYSDIRPIEYPPKLPMPGAKAREVDETGHIGFDNPPLSSLPCIQAPFEALCELSIIMQEVAVVYRSNASSPSRQPPLAFAESKYQQLLRWADRLDPKLFGSEDHSDSVVIFQLAFHSAILDIFCPFTADSSLRRLQSFSSRQNSIKAVVRASVNQLRHLMLLCCIKHQNLCTVSTTTSAVIHVANAMLSDAASSLSGGKERRMADDDSDGDDVESRHVGQDADPSWRFYFSLCLANCQQLMKCFPSCATIGRALLNMAVGNGVLSAADARLLADEFQSRKKEHTFQGAPGSVDVNSSSFYVDFELARTAPEEAKAKVLAQRFDEALVFDELINQDFVIPERPARSSNRE